MELHLELGALQADIADQLDEQDLLFDPMIIAHIQKDTDAVTRLLIRDFLTLKQSQNLTKKIYTAVVDHLAEASKTKGDA